MSDFNRQPTVAYGENQPTVNTDSTHNNDATTTGSDALLFRDKDLMSGITSINQTMQKAPVDLPSLELTDAEEDDHGEHLISFEPPQTTDQPAPAGRDGGQPLPERQALTSQQISQIITNLDSPSFHTRDRAQGDIIAAGPAALPQLLQAINNPPSLEVQRRAQMGVRDITANMSTEQLIALRDPANRQRAIRDGVNAPLTAEQMRTIDSAMEDTARSSMESRLTPPAWLNHLDLGFKGKLGVFNRVPTEESIREFDRMDTPEGRRQVSRRISELNQMRDSEHITNAEREIISRQLSEIARASSPEFIADGRVNSRVNLADHLNQTGGNPDRISTLMLEAHRLSDRPEPAPGAQQQLLGFHPNIREQVRQNMVRMGLDQNPGFMQRFQTQAGQAEAQALRDIRTQMEAQRRFDAEQGQRGNK